MASRGDSTSGGAEFQPTQWSLVIAASRPDSPEARAALTKLCETYWYPIRAFLRRKGYDPEAAQDLTQELFAQLIEKRTYEAADRERGRFRSFLLGCLKNLLSHEFRKENTIKRGGQITFVPLDDALAEERYGAEPIDEMSPEKLFERRWALTLIEQALEILKLEYTESGRGQLFEVLQAFLPGAAEAPISYAEAGSQLGLNENAARQAAFRLRERLGEVFRGLVAQTVAGPAELDEELAHLRAILTA